MCDFARCDKFPFTGAFEELFAGSWSVEKLRDWSDAVDEALDIGEEEVTAASDKEMIAMLCSLVTLRARLNVAELFEKEIAAGVRDCELFDLVSEAQQAWLDVVHTQGVITCAVNEEALSLLRSTTTPVWEHVAIETGMCVEKFAETFPEFEAIVSFKVVNGMCIESSASKPGRYAHEMVGEEKTFPVLTRGFYACLLAGDGIAYKTGESLTGAGYHLTAERVKDWLWLMQPRAEAGYCYQKWHPPLNRRILCEGQPPLRPLSEVACVDDWTTVPAQVVYSGGPGVLHVETCGRYVASAGQAETVMVGMLGLPDRRHGPWQPVPAAEGGPPPDFYAKAMVDDICKGLRAKAGVKDPDKTNELEAAVSLLELDQSSLGYRAFVKVSEDMYRQIGEELSPRSRTGGPRIFGMNDVSDDNVTLDSERLVAFKSRLSSGPAIPEEYYKLLRSRLHRGRRRPELLSDTGSMYHVFDSFPAGGGFDPSVWKVDEKWQCDGWVSYRLKLAPGTDTVVSFVGEGKDIRMDCTGDGLLELGEGAIYLDRVVLWFTESIRMRVQAKGRAYLRVSVPSEGVAKVVPEEIRRYMYLPGYCMIARTFDVRNHQASVHLRVVVDREASGTSLSHATGSFEAGKTKVKFVGLPSAAPVRFLLKCSPSEALKYVSVCGLRQRSAKRDFVAFLTDLSGCDFTVCLHAAARIDVSVVQVVDVKSFDATVNAMSVQNH